MTTIEDFTSQYGLVEKIDAFGYLKYLAENPDAPRKHGKVILVTADTPLKASRGEGKTTTTIALIDALNKRGIDAAAVLRQPSMGITAAGSKGGASGGGKASLTHPELIDWGLCGEMGAIEAAQNLLVSFAEKAVDEGKLDTVLVPRVSEVPSRSLRSIAVDYGKGNVAEKTVLTPTSELMQIVVLSRSMDEIAERVSKMIAGTKDGQAVTFGEFVDLWRITGIQVPSLQATADELGFRTPIIGNLFRDGGEALAPQLDGFIDALENGSMPAEPRSHKGMALTENAKWVAENAYGVPADRVIYKPGFTESMAEAMELCQSAGISLDDLAFVAVKSPATMTDNDRAPEAERAVTLKKVEVHAGAGLVHVNLTTSLTTPMPKIV